MTATELAIVQRWSGTIQLDSDTAGVEGLLVRDDAAYDALIARLPARRVQMRQPAPPSSDPLRQRPPIDFATHMLVVVTRSGSPDAPLLARVVAEPGRVIARHAVHPPPPEARAYKIGGYSAALVPRAEGELALVGPRVIDDEAALPSAVGELVTLRGTLTRTKIPTLLGVDVDEGMADPEQPVLATGWLEREVVTREELERLTAEHGHFAHRGPGTFYRLVDPLGRGLARAQQRW